MLLFMFKKCALNLECCNTVMKTTNQFCCSMSTAKVIIQISAFQKLLITVLFHTRVRLLKVMYLHHVPLQIEFQSKHLCTTWLGASIRLFFFVHNSNVHSQMALPIELLQALAALVRLFFAVHTFNMSLQGGFGCKCHVTVFEVTIKWFCELTLNVCLHTAQGCHRVLVSLISWPGQLLSLNPCRRPKILARMLFLRILSLTVVIVRGHYSLIDWRLWLNIGENIQT